MSIKWLVRKDDFAKIKSSMPQALHRALFEEANDIMADSRSNYVPVVSGRLRDSGKVVPVDDGVELVYDTPYAKKVHEAPPEVGQGKNKYLEKPVLKAARGFQSRVRRRMKGY